MATFAELQDAAIARYDSGDIEGAKRLKKEALATQEYERLETEAISAYDNGDIETAKALKKQAIDTITPFQESRFTDIGRGILAAPVTVAQGISEAAALGLDWSMGTEYSRPVTEVLFLLLVGWVVQVPLPEGQPEPNPPVDFSKVRRSLAHHQKARNFWTHGQN